MHRPSHFSELRGIVDSLGRSRRLIEKSVRLSESYANNESKQTCSSKCLLCPVGSCTRYARSSQGSLSSSNYLQSYESSPQKNLLLQSLQLENEALVKQNRLLSDKIQDITAELTQFKPVFNGENSLSRDSVKTVNERIYDLEKKLDSIEDAHGRSLKASKSSTEASSRYSKIKQQISRTDKKFENLWKKIDVAEEIMRNRMKDRHCFKCIER